MIAHQSDTFGFFVPLYSLNESGVSTFIGRLSLEHIQSSYPTARIIRAKLGRPVRAIVGEAVAATHIGQIQGGQVYRQHLASGHACWSMRRARRIECR